MRYEFTLQLIGYSEITDKIEDNLFSAGCADAFLHSIDNNVYLDFSREAMSYEEAVNSAKTDLARVEYKAILIDENKQSTISTSF